MERGLLVRLEDRDYQYFDGVYIYMYVLYYVKQKKFANRNLQRSVIVYFVGRVVGNVVPFKLDR